MPSASAVDPSTHRPPTSPCPPAPVLLKEDTTQRFGVELKSAEKRYVRLATEIKKVILGPMPIRKFLQFLPRVSEESPDASLAFAPLEEALILDEREVAMYEPMVKALRGRCPDFVFKNTSTRGVDQGKRGSMRPDICMYAEKVVDLVQNNQTTKEPAGDLGLADLFFEVKAKPEQDYFEDPPSNAKRNIPPFIRSFTDPVDKYNADRDLGQNGAYSNEACLRQCRVCYYSVVMAGLQARLLRWDRAGVIVSQAFHLKHQPQYLCEFLWRYSHASPRDRGYDDTIEVASPMEVAMFERCIKRHVLLQLGIETETAETEAAVAAATEVHLQTPYGVLAITIMDGSKKTHRLLISRPIIEPLSLTGRATVGYWAICTDGEEVVFLKDTWRFIAQDEIEGKVLSDLAEAGVRNIPNVKYYADVWDGKGSQRTRTQEYVKAGWVRRSAGIDTEIFGHIHHRLVSGTVGFGLERFEGSKELLHATYDAYTAMHAAYSLKGSLRRLHRGISVASIFLVRSKTDQLHGIRCGVLMDWENSCLVNDRSTHHYPNTCDVQFKSIISLGFYRTPVQYSIQDDMESLFWVILYCCLVWLEHNQPDDKVLSIMKELFDEPRGKDKFCYFSSGLPLREVKFTNVALSDWLRTMSKFAGTRHEKVTEQQDVDTWSDTLLFKAYWEHYITSSDLHKDDRISRLIKSDRVPYRVQATDVPLRAINAICDLVARGEKAFLPQDNSGSSSKKSNVTHVVPPKVKAKPVPQRVRCRRGMDHSANPPYKGPVTRSRA